MGPEELHPQAIESAFDFGPSQRQVCTHPGGHGFSGFRAERGGHEGWGGRNLNPIARHDSPHMQRQHRGLFGV